MIETEKAATLQLVKPINKPYRDLLVAQVHYFADIVRGMLESRELNDAIGYSCEPNRDPRCIQTVWLEKLVHALDDLGSFDELQQRAREIATELTVQPVESYKWLDQGTVNRGQLEEAWQCYRDSPAGKKEHADFEARCDPNTYDAWLKQQGHEVEVLENGVRVVKWKKEDRDES